MPHPLTLPELRRYARAARHGASVTLGRVAFGHGTLHSRVNIENAEKMEQAGFFAGSRFRVSYSPGLVEIQTDERGDHVVSGRTDRTRSGKITHRHRLDLRSLQVHEALQGTDKALVLYLDGLILVLHLPSVVHANHRIQRLLDSVQGKSLETASLYTGLGTLDLALHEGLAKGGIATHLVFTNDLEEHTQDALLADNPAAGGPTQTTACPIEELIATGVWPRPHLVALGIPCTGASRNNVATRDNPEKHEHAGHQFANALLALQGMDWPPLVLIENVVEYAGSTGFSVLRRVLESQGYDTALIGDSGPDDRYLGIQSADYGDIERRRRMAFLAYPKGLDISEFAIEKTGPSTRIVGNIRLDESLIDPTDYGKGLRLDAEYRKSRKNNIVDDADTSTPCMTAHCYKMRPEDPKFRHPSKPGLWRLPVPEEHAALKGWPTSIIDSLVYATHAHVALGNGVTRGCWVAFGEALARWLVSQQAAMEATLAPTRRQIDPGTVFGPLFATA